MASLYRQLKDAEKQRYKACRPFTKGYNDGKDIPLGFRIAKEKYDKMELDIMEDYRLNSPIFMEMSYDKGYLAKMRDEYGRPALVLTDMWKQKRKLDSGFKEVIGMRPLAKSFIPFLDYYRRKESDRRMQFIFETAFCVLSANG